tara:strand:- start:293 stop:556 length:264 start_codon:yes stop_codon:yes gene_type:complete
MSKRLSIYLAGRITNPKTGVGEEGVSIGEMGRKWRKVAAKALQEKYIVHDPFLKNDDPFFADWPKPIQPTVKEKEEAWAAGIKDYQK